MRRGGIRPTQESRRRSCDRPNHPAASVFIGSRIGWAPCPGAPTRDKTTTEWVGRPGEPLPDGSRDRRTTGAGPVSGLHHPVGGGARPLDARGDRGLGRPAGSRARQGHRRAARGAARRGTGARAVPDAWSRWSSGPGCPRKSWSGSSGPGRWIRWGGRGASSCGSCARWPARHAAGWTGARCAAWAGRPASVRRRPGGRWTCAFPPPRLRRCRRSPSRSGSAIPTRSSGWMHGARS